MRSIFCVSISIASSVCVMEMCLWKTNNIYLDCLLFHLLPFCVCVYVSYLPFVWNTIDMSQWSFFFLSFFSISLFSFRLFWLRYDFQKYYFPQFLIVYLFDFQWFCDRFGHHLWSAHNILNVCVCVDIIYFVVWLFIKGF